MISDPELLDELLPDLPWRETLALCNITGLADARHIHQSTGLSYKVLRRLLDTLAQPPAGEALLTIITASISRPARRGRPPTLYALAPAGAAALRHSGHEARPSRLENPRAIAHALAMLDIHLALQAIGLPIKTDRTLSFEPQRSLRPDHQLTLPTGRLLLEVEQDAAPALLRRMRDTLANRWDFFATNPEGFLPQVRLLINLRPGKRYERTLKIWQQALGMLTQERGAEIPFTLWAIPLPVFLTNPQMNPDPLSPWEQINHRKAKTTAAQSDRRSTPPAAESPPDWAGDLAALRVQAADLAAAPPEKEYIPPSFIFLEIADLIFATAKTATEQTYLFDNRPPLSAIALLRLYLERHPALYSQLKILVRSSERRRVWYSRDAIRHAQRIVDAFLAYHGWHNRLIVWATVREENVGEPMFPYAVSMSPFPVPSGMSPHRANDALAWVCWALLAYSDKFGLGRLPYW